MQQTEVPLRRAYFIFVIVGVALFIAATDATTVVVALPKIADDLDAQVGWIGWIVSGYQFSQTIALPIAGKLSDTLGRKRLFLWSVGLFIFSALGAALAPNIYVLIVCRVFQGIGAGGFMPSATGIVGDSFGLGKRATMVGLFSSILPLGGIAGPNIGGAIADHASWRWIFVVNAPLGLLALVMAVWLIPKGKASGVARRIDVRGSAILAAAALSFMYGMTAWANNPDNLAHPSVWLFFVLAIVFTVLLVRHGLRTADPIMDPRLLRQKPFIAVNAFSFVQGCILFGTFAFTPYFMKAAYDLSGTDVGIVLTPRFGVTAACAIFASLMLLRLGYRALLVGGGLCIVVGNIAFAVGDYGFAPMVMLTVLMTITGAGVGLINPALSNAALDLEPSKLAAITGQRGMFRALGAAFAISIASVLLSTFSSEVDGLKVHFIVMSLLFLVSLPLVLWIPEVAKGQRKGKAAQASP